MVNSGVQRQADPLSPALVGCRPPPRPLPPPRLTLPAGWLHGRPPDHHLGSGADRHAALQGREGGGAGAGSLPLMSSYYSHPAGRGHSAHVYTTSEEAMGGLRWGGSGCAWVYAADGLVKTRLCHGGTTPRLTPPTTRAPPPPPHPYPTHPHPCRWLPPCGSSSSPHQAWWWAWPRTGGWVGACAGGGGGALLVCACVHAGGRVCARACVPCACLCELRACVCVVIARALLCLGVYQESPRVPHPPKQVHRQLPRARPPRDAGPAPDRLAGGAGRGASLL